MAKPRKAKIVAAVGTASGSLDPMRKNASKLIEQAMAQAVQECVEEGVSLSDDVVIKARMMAARERVRRMLWPNLISSESPS